MGGAPLPADDAMATARSRALVADPESFRFQSKAFCWIKPAPEGTDFDELRHCWAHRLAQVLAAPPPVPAKRQHEHLTDRDKGRLGECAYEMFQCMKRVRGADGEQLLGEHAAYEPTLLAAAIALWRGWFTKGTATPNPTAAAACFQEGAPANTRTAKAVKDWLKRITELIAATEKEDISLLVVRRMRMQRLQGLARTSLGYCPHRGYCPGADCKNTAFASERHVENCVYWASVHFC